MSDEMILVLASDIVVAHVGNNEVAVEQLPNLIKVVFDTLSSLGQPTPVLEEEPKPAVSIRSSVKHDAITCLECGAKFKMLKRHLATDHSLTPADYRARWGLPNDYPMTAPGYSNMRKEMAVKIGLGRKPNKKPRRAKSGRVATKA